MRKWTYHWGWGITIVYTAFAVATLGFVYFAMTQNVDLVREDYYQYSLDHDKHAEAMRRTAALGAAAEIVTLQDVVRIDIPNDHRPTFKGTVHFYHPARPEWDRWHDLVTDESGVMLIPVGDLQKGTWTVTVVWQSGGFEYEMQRTVTIG
jgi:nitrogen fixation protein FixH